MFKLHGLGAQYLNADFARRGTEVQIPLIRRSIVDSPALTAFASERKAGPGGGMGKLWWICRVKHRHHCSP